MPIKFTCRVIHWPRTLKLSIAGTWTVAVIPTTWSPSSLRISCSCHCGSGKPPRLWLSKTRSDSTPCSRLYISWEKPSITLLTTISVATPSVTLMIEASAM